MQKDKVSIIIPIYNTEKYLDACIQSVLQQTYTNWELVLVNDGSTDTSWEMCCKYADNDKRIVAISQTNQGVSAARNTGLLRATGNYILFLDSDDELEMKALEILVLDIIQYNADMVFAGKSIVTATNVTKCIYNDGNVYIHEGDELLKRSLLYDGLSRSLHSKLFTKTFLCDVWFDEGHNINEDGYFLFQCFVKQPKTVQHNVSLYKYFIRKNSSSRDSFSEKYFDMLYFCNLKKKYIIENKQSFLEYAWDMEVRTHLLFLDVLCREKTSKYKKYTKESITVVRERYFSFHPISRHEKILLTAVLCGCYPVYKFLFRLKYYR